MGGERAEDEAPQGVQKEAFLACANTQIDGFTPLLDIPESSRA
jgi:hypothetical protein